MIQVNDISFGYGSGKVIENLSFSVEAGETLMITGPNGVGKSTILRLLAGVAKPSAGCIEHGLPAGVDPRSKTAYLPDSLSMYRSMTPLQAAAFHARVFDSEVAQMELARSAGTDLGRPISELSVGQQVLVHLEIVLATSPGLILIDEVIHTIDPHIRGLVIERLILEMEQRHPSMVMVNLNFVEVEFLIDRLLFLGRDGIVLDEPVDKLKSSIRKLKSDPEPEGFPILLSRETPTGREHVVYPIGADSGSEGLIEMDLTEIITAFMETVYRA